ncbi:MAG TPA: plastocyanin/azurin family copper-binding protein [Rubricoccaceae bacterium]|nr:plastocyanin/azurin family copper-binding protein [Rubricoccaceae bacterium]
MRALLALLSLALLPACFSSEPAPTEPIDDPATVTVEMTDGLVFDPSPVTISVGDTVEWVNASSMVHTATADPALAANPDNVQLPAGAEPFDSGFLTAGQRFSYTFTVAGEYRYVCLPHEFAGMIGTITVNE